MPELDGLRALAALAVVLLHARVPYASGGAIGVDVFFVLSGYLITRLLEESHPTLGDFYRRRLMRLTPPLVAMLCAYALVFPLLRPGYPHLRDAGLSALYLTDYAVPWLGRFQYVGHTWSLAVEEHFYLLWPLLLRRFRPGLRALALAYVAATIWRNVHDERLVWYFRFDTRLSGLILGCLIARLPRGRLPAWPGLLLLLAVVAGSWSSARDVQWLQIPLAEFGAALTILGRAPGWLSARPLVYLGKLSYGIYLWHFPLSRLFVEAREAWWISLPCTLAFSAGMAALSYHALEPRFRRKPSQRASPG